MWDPEIGWRDFLKAKRSSFLRMRARSAVLGVFVCISWASLFGLPSALCADYSKPPPPPVTEWRSGFSRQSRMQGAVYSIGQPTAEEQYYVELINRARANPKAEGERLAATKSPEVTSSLRYFGVDLEQMKREFATLSAMPPLAINPKLTECARGHSQDMFNRIPEVRRLRDLYSNHSLNMVKFTLLNLPVHSQSQQLVK